MQAESQFLFQIWFHFVTGSTEYFFGFGPKRLNNHFTGFGSSASANKLCEQLEYSLTGAEVREGKTNICQHHCCECDIREIQSFHDRLCAEQNIGITAFHGIQKRGDADILLGTQSVVK